MVSPNLIIRKVKGYGSQCMKGASDMKCVFVKYQPFLVMTCINLIDGFFPKVILLSMSASRVKIFNLYPIYAPNDKIGGVPKSG